MNERMSRALVWIRRDLRLVDHVALARACAVAQSVAMVFVFDTEILKKLPTVYDKRVNFIWKSLVTLNEQLIQKGSRLVIVHGNPVDLIPRLASDWNADAVFVNADYEPSALFRDQQVESILGAWGKRFFSFKDQVIFEKREVLSKTQEPFQVFTPYKRAWLSRLESLAHDPISPHKPDLSRLCPLVQLSSLPGIPQSIKEIGFEETHLTVEAGTAAAHTCLKNFCDEKIAFYKDKRNFVAENFTSGLSVHLRFGTLSIRTAVRAALACGVSEGAACWLSELIWRDFYHMILSCNPHLAQGRTYQKKYDALKWPGTPEHFERWCQGKTGYPLVDAAMRYFNQTGCMHNRLRMVVASFLTKDLLVDWRLGEKYFSDYLLDFDFAANNGGWQWSASTGCDAQPYFRIFNPIEQSKRFDPNGDFIRSVLPELAHLGPDHIHWPHGLLNGAAKKKGVGAQGMFECVTPRSYVEPVVDHALQRNKAMALFGVH